MINTETVTTDLRPPKKPLKLGKYFRKVETNYEDIIGFQDKFFSTDGRYTSMMLIASFKDDNQFAMGFLAMIFFFCLLLAQFVMFMAGGTWAVFYPGYDMFNWPIEYYVQVLLVIYAAIQFKKSKKKQALAVVCDRKTGNVNFPALCGNPELVIPFDKIDLYRGSVASSLGSGMPVHVLVPQMYPSSAKRDFQGVILFADSYDEACSRWTLLTEFMDKNKPIPYGLLQSVQSHIDDNEAAIWRGTDVKARYPLDPEIKNNYKYVFHTNYEETVEYPYDEINSVIAPFSDDPELLKKNIQRAHDLYILL
ncbi:hypothetical protein KO495_13875 [Colwellia sp. D2M02]|uniref:hypothetical protein n=1 Tax=Colwellia sp. D2M02 TaxID=2841562 RepID=UPI001C092F60|nr:hypothetical protein [Colwellia sp. D2M02]MBU2894398.1 hypothetical protein [Colwellia sp. D2M02]